MLFGLFGKKKSDAERNAERQRSALGAILNQNQQASANPMPTGTAFYQSGRGGVMDFLRQSREQDAQLSASRGMLGGEAEVAQAGQRQMTAASALRDLLASSETMQENKRRADLGNLLAYQSLLEGAAGRGAAERIRNKDRTAEMIGNISGALTSVLTGGVK